VLICVKNKSIFLLCLYFFRLGTPSYKKNHHSPKFIPKLRNLCCIKVQKGLKFEFLQEFSKIITYKFDREIHLGKNNEKLVFIVNI
jgi:hypothetical protein